MKKKQFIQKLFSAFLSLALLTGCAATQIAREPEKTGEFVQSVSSSASSQNQSSAVKPGSAASKAASSSQADKPAPFGGTSSAEPSASSALLEQLRALVNPAAAKPAKKTTSSSSAASKAASSSSVSSKTSASASSAVSSKASSASSAPAAPAVPPPFVHSARMVVAYYGGWSAYSGFGPDKISASNLDVLNYAFAKIGTDLRIAVGDSTIDYTNFNKLKLLKSANPGLRTVISIGGWEDSGRFSDAALTESSRAVFADSVVRFLKTYGFDGADIDWEYPTGGGLSSNVTRAVDKTNFGLLLKTLRSKLDAQGIIDKKHYILSFAGAANYRYASGVGMSNISKYVDYGIIMTYDIHGNWDTYTDFNAPLYLPAGSSPQYKASVDSAVNTWLNSGFPAGKLVMGVPFYGYVYNGVANVNNGLWQRFTSGSAAGYDTIQAKYGNNTAYRKYYDSTAAVPWLFNGSTFVSYDNEASIIKKAQYAVSKNLLGVGAWELSFDRSAVLLRAVNRTLG